MPVVFILSSIKRPFFWRFFLIIKFIFKPANRKSIFVEFLLKFLASTQDEIHHLIVKFSCKNAYENLGVISARSAICFFAANIEVEQELIASAIMTALFTFTRF